MKVFKPLYQYVYDNDHDIQVKFDSSELDKFNPELLNIGDLKAPSEPVEVLSVIFDLESFTHFTKQIDPQLTIPNFITDFFNWLYDSLKRNIVVNDKKNYLWAEFPFFSKFTGDGAMFLWSIDVNKIKKIDKDIERAELQSKMQTLICSIIATMLDICRDYNNFYKQLSRKYIDPPDRLRCGIARGNAFPIGKGSDYVGPCINLSSRLQKYNGLSFAFSARGIEKSGFHDSYQDEFILVKGNIRGIGENELIYVLKEEFDVLPNDLRGYFSKV